MGRLFLLSLFSLFTFSQLTFAIPPLRSDFRDDSLKFHGIQEGVITPRYRLPASLKPTHYDLEIRPILDEGYGVRFTAPGKVTISVDCSAPTSEIVLHSLGTTIQQINVTDAANGAITPTVGEPEFNLQNQTVTIKLGGNLVAGRSYFIYIEFTSLVAQNRVDGLYLSSYIDPASGETRYLAATDLEADDARRIFPLFDEPALKATWNVSILRTKNYHSLGNQDKVGESEPVDGEPEWVRDTFREVVKMSTYLLAFAVSDFESEFAHDSFFGGKPVGIWGPPPIMQKGGGLYSANISAQLLEAFEEMYDYPYSLEKMDKISLPDFNSGAMENWGLNTYREGRLLFLDGISTIEDKVRMTNTISHELAHQWFGNLVTMKWWNDLWLNEGFATYMAALGVEAVCKDYYQMDLLLVNSIQPAMLVDVSSNAHPISPNPELVQNETDFSRMFSTIVYHKGASVIRMMNAFLATPANKNVMMDGLKEYLKAFDYDSAEQNDLFDVLYENALPEAFPLPVAGNNITLHQIMETWTKQSGYPILHVAKSPTTLTFRQEPYGNLEAKHWWIPITYAKQGYAENDPELTTTILWLGTEQIVHPETSEIDEWILVNPRQIGNYRVAYDMVNFNLITIHLSSNETHMDIDSLSKSALLDDYFNLGYDKSFTAVSIENALALTTFLPFERHFAPWSTFLTNMASSYRMFGRSSFFLQYRTKMLSLIKPVLEDITYEEQIDDKPGREIMLRTRLVEWACNLGDSVCVEFAQKKFSEWMEAPIPATNNSINPDLRTTIYCTAMANGGDAEWDFILARYLDAGEATPSKYLPDVARISLVRALGCSKQSYRLAKVLDYVLNSQSFILPEHRLTALQAVAGNSAGIDLTFNFLRNNIATLVRRYGAGFFASSVSTLSNYMNTQLEERDLQAFINTNNELLAPVMTSINTSIQNIRKNIEWMSRTNDNVASFEDWARS